MPTIEMFPHILFGASQTTNTMFHLLWEALQFLPFLTRVLFQQSASITEIGNALGAPAVCAQHAQGAVCACSHVCDHIHVHARSSWSRAPGEVL